MACGTVPVMQDHHFCLVQNTFIPKWACTGEWWCDFNVWHWSSPFQGSGDVALKSDIDNHLFMRRGKKIQEQILCFLIFYFTITYAFGFLQIYKGNTFSVQKTKKKNHENQKYHQTQGKVHTRPFWKKYSQIFCVWVEVWTCERICTMTFCQSTVIFLSLF